MEELYETPQGINRIKQRTLTVLAMHQAHTAVIGERSVLAAHNNEAIAPVKY